MELVELGVTATEAPDLPKWDEDVQVSVRAWFGVWRIASAIPVESPQPIGRKVGHAHVVRRAKLKAGLALKRELSGEPVAEIEMESPPANREAEEEIELLKAEVVELREIEERFSPDRRIILQSTAFLAFFQLCLLSRLLGEPVLDLTWNILGSLVSLGFIGMGFLMRWDFKRRTKDDDPEDG